MKLHYLCNPYPGEWAYSLAARTKHVLALGSSHLIAHLMFGIRKISLGLGIVSNRSGFSSSFETLTLLRFITAFMLPPLKRSQTREALAAGDYNRVGFNLGRCGSRRLYAENLRYCPTCAEEQRHKLGEAYWCCLAQVVGVPFCPIHKVPFLNSVISRRYPSGLVRLEDALSQGSTGPAIEAGHEDALLSLSVAASQLLDFETFWDTARLKRSWRGLLGDFGIRERSRGAAKFMGRGLRDRFGDAYLEASGCGIGVSPEASWVGRFLRNPAKEADPLRHLLILECVGRSLNDLADGARIHLADPRIHEGALACHNPVCPQRDKPWSGQTRIFVSPHTRMETAHLTCGACSQTIGRLLEKRTGDSDDWIVDRGELWNSHLREMWADAGKSLRKIAASLGADPMTIKRHALREGLIFPRAGKRLTRTLPSGIRKRKVDDGKEREHRRKLWMKAVASGKTTNDARKLDSAAYAWLRRNDLGWLRANKPARVALSVTGAGRVDWIKRQELYLQKLPDAYFRITMRRPYQQCTKTAMLQEVGGERELAYLDRMPLFKAQIDEFAEDVNRFALRRLAATIEEIEAPVTMNQLCKRAGVRPSVAEIPAVREWIMERAKKSLRHSFRTDL